MTDKDTGKKKKLVYFPPEVMKLNLETRHHPALVEIIQKLPGNPSMGTIIATVGIYVEVYVEGDFKPEEVRMICARLTQKLYEKRTANIIVSPEADSKGTVH